MKLKIWSNLGVFAYSGRHSKLIQVKFGIEAYSLGLLCHTMFGPDRSMDGYSSPQSSNLVKFAVLCPVRVTVYTGIHHGEIWQNRILQWVHSFMPNLALIGEGVSTGAPKSSKFGQYCGILAVFGPAGGTVYTDQNEIWRGRAQQRFSHSCQI